MRKDQICKKAKKQLKRGAEQPWRMKEENMWLMRLPRLIFQTETWKTRTTAGEAVLGDLGCLGWPLKSESQHGHTGIIS